MKHILAILMLTLSIGAIAQAPQFKSGSTVYIEPMDGYEFYLAAAMMKKHVPLVAVADQTKADFYITSTKRTADDSTSASISVIDAHSSQIIFAYSVGNSRSTTYQVQRTAEACAKHLKEFIEK